MSESKYPEHEKLRAVKDKSQTIGDFLSWLDENDRVICKRDRDGDFCPVRGTIEKLLAEYFEIDLRKISAEKDAMVDELRAGQ